MPVNFKQRCGVGPALKCLQNRVNMMQLHVHNLDLTAVLPYSGVRTVYTTLKLGFAQIKLKIKLKGRVILIAVPLYILAEGSSKNRGISNVTNCY
jgi:hypothetical protein